MANNYQQYNNPNADYSNVNYSNDNNGGFFKKHKKPILILAVLLVAFVGIFLLFGNRSESYDRKSGNWDRLIMIYMVGSNLESGQLGLGTLDLNGINYSSVENNRAKVIVMAGGAKTWHNNYIDKQATSIYELTSSGYKVVKKNKLQNMGSSSVLSDFLNYGYNSYEAKKYDLILWNHGLGALGYGSDEISSDYLSLDEINSAFKTSPFKGSNKLELVAFRTCLNGTIEVADVLKDHADYMIASQEITRGYVGDNVLKILNDFKITDDGKQFGIKFVDGYMSYMKYINDRGAYTYNTYSVIDLSKIEKVEKALAVFVNDINLSSYYSTVAKARSATFQYASEQDPTYDSIDLYTFVSKLSYLSPSKANELLASLNEAIVYNKATDTQSKGLSIYFPYNGDASSKQSILSRMYNFDGLKDYKSFIVSFNNIQSSNTTPLSFSTSAIDLTHDSKKKQADFQITLTDEQAEQFDKASYVVLEKEDKNIYFPVYYSAGLQIEGKQLKASIKDRQLKLVSKAKGDEDLAVYTFHDDDITKVDSEYKKEQQITLIEATETDDIILYYSLVTLSNKGLLDSDEELSTTSAKMYIKLNKSTGEVSIDKILLKSGGEESGETPSTDYVIIGNLEDYKYITFTFTTTIMPEKIEDIEWFNGKMSLIQIETKNLKFELEDYTNKKEYYALFQIDDIYGNHTYPDLIKLK